MARKPKPRAPRVLTPEPELIQPEPDLLLTEPGPAPKPRGVSPGLPAGIPEGGLECRHCGCRHFDVVYVERPRIGNYIVRRRECRHCGRRITTREQIVGPG